ncbi:MAG: Do family serine endopeptidase [Alphaproteobacteria bacterium]|nr:Do family serine endopeptidase [Alphaproteobacteria bacterium]
MSRKSVSCVTFVAGFLVACVAGEGVRAAQEPGDMSGMASSQRVPPGSIGEVKMSFAPIVDAAAPAVVNVFTKRQVSRTTGDPFFDRFLGIGASEQTSLGSGVIVSPDGLIVTNNHVIENMTEIKVVFVDRREFEAEVLLTDPQTDLAVLRIKADEPLPFLEFANSDAAEVGDMVLAIGNPFGVGQTVTSGIVSALARTSVSAGRRSAGSGSDYQYFIQTDAAINPGNSGGALVDSDGRLLGVNTAIYSRSGGSDGVGFAVPSSLVRQVIATATNGGSVHRPWVSAATDSVQATLASALGLDRPVGAIVNEVYPGGALDNAGIRAGDIIIKVADEPILDSETLRYRFGVQEPGAQADITFVRDGVQRRAKITFELAPDRPDSAEVLLEGGHPMAGVAVANLSPRFNEEQGFDPLLRGVVVTDAPARSFAARRGLRRGFRILGVNGKRVETVEDLMELLESARQRWDIEVDLGNRIVNWCTDESGRRCR